MMGILIVYSLLFHGNAEALRVSLYVTEHASFAFIVELNIYYTPSPDFSMVKWSLRIGLRLQRDHSAIARTWY